jgi:hypothetical protein
VLPLLQGDVDWRSASRERRECDGAGRVLGTAAILHVNRARSSSPRIAYNFRDQMAGEIDMTMIAEQRGAR